MRRSCPKVKHHFGDMAEIAETRKPFYVGLFFILSRAKQKVVWLVKFQFSVVPAYANPGKFQRATRQILASHEHAPKITPHPHNSLYLFIGQRWTGIAQPSL